MRATHSWVLVVATLAAGAAVAAGGPPVWTFSTEAAGQLPAGFTLAAMRQHSPGDWQVVRHHASGGVLVHAAAPDSTGYAMAIAPGDPVPDVLASVRVRLAGGARAGGLVWRYHDPHNYYMAILDLGARELLLYRVLNGNRIRLDHEDGLELDVNAWHTLKVVHDGARVFVMLGGIRVFQDHDPRHDSASGAGAAGLVATGDSEVWYDDLRIEPWHGH